MYIVTFLNLKSKYNFYKINIMTELFFFKSI